MDAREMEFAFLEEAGQIVLGDGGHCGWGWIKLGGYLHHTVRYIQHASEGLAI